MQDKQVEFVQLMHKLNHIVHQIEQATPDWAALPAYRKPIAALQVAEDAKAHLTESITLVTAIACPTEGCGEICTVHAVGEHRLQETGEIPKNKRRLGQLYTVCPNCKTNQSAGKPFQTWIEKYMQPTREQVKAHALNRSTDVPPRKTVNPKEKETINVVSDAEKPSDIEPNPTVKSSVMTWMLGISAVMVVAGLWLTRRKKERSHEPIRDA